MSAFYALLADTTFLDTLVANNSALPNLHPAVVHFPVALVLVALLFDLLVLGLRKGWLDKAATLLWVLAGFAAGAAYLSGDAAGDSASDLSGAAQVSMADHSDRALMTLVAVVIVALLRVVIGWLDRDADTPRHLGFRGLVLVASLGAATLLGLTADLGGSLVYEHGVHVKVAAFPEPTPTPMPTTDDPMAAVQKGAGGSITWQPDPELGGVLGSVLTAADGSSLGAIEAMPGADARGLTFRVEGRSVLALPTAADDVQITATVDLTTYRGSFGLLFRMSHSSDWDGFVVGPDNRLALVRASEGGAEVLSDSGDGVPSGMIELSTSAVDDHLKGIVGGETKLHEHLQPLEGRQVGLLMEGSGTVVIRSIQVEDLSASE